MRERHPSRYFHTPLTEERRDRNWEAIAARLPVRRRQQRRARQSLAFAALVLALIAVVATRVVAPSRGAIDGAVLVTGAGERQSLELGDGSQIVLEPSTKLQLAAVSGREIRLELESGAVAASVVHVLDRPFTVVAGPVAVRVVGTKFRVELEPADGSILVAVTEGRVSLSRSDGKPAPSTLGAGETWSSAVRPVAPLPSSPSSAAAPPAVGSGPARAVAQAPALSKKFREHWREGRFAEAWAEISSSDLDRIINTAGPQDVFAIAEVARMSGHPFEAAEALDSLRRRFRSNPRAPLAALELGRLRLNELGVPLAAKEAFEDAIALDPNGSFREDADARLVEALEAAGLWSECAEARDRYLATYPEGLYMGAVKRRCR